VSSQQTEVQRSKTRIKNSRLERRRTFFTRLCLQPGRVDSFSIDHAPGFTLLMWFTSSNLLVTLQAIHPNCAGKLQLSGRLRSSPVPDFAESPSPRTKITVAGICRKRLPISSAARDNFWCSGESSFCCVLVGG